MPTRPVVAAADDRLAPFRERAIHLFVRDKVLREQISVILAILGFINLKVHGTEGGYLDNVRRLAALLIQHEGVFLLNPPLVVYGQGGKAKIKKEFTDFFTDLSLVLGRSKKENFRIVSKCVPIFADIQLTQKREKTIAGLARHGVTGCFILKPQESLRGLNPNFYRVRMKEQIMERVEEVRAYLSEYLPHTEGALRELMQKREERELSERKAEADALMKSGHKAKAQGNFELAIECFKKAIDLFPQDPDAYLESGRVYVHVKQYPKALLRFSQAEELAENIPEPNKEIAMVRMLQVGERIAKGEAPDSPAIMALLEEAMQHFETALTKAEKVQAQREENEALGGAETVSRIASEMIKLDLRTMLGKKHPMVKRLGDLARESFRKIADQQPEALQPRQILFLGVAAMDDRNFPEAEEHFFKAVEFPDVFTEACNEITHMGIVVRKLVGARKAIEIYTRLLTHSPPNSAVVYYNLAVSFSVEKNYIESAGAIVQALFLDPTLAENTMFYNNPHLNQVMHKVTKVTERIAPRLSSVRVPVLTSRAVQLHEKMERLITRKDKRAFRLLQHVVEVMPEFFLREHVAASKVILNYMRTKREQCREGKLQETRDFGDYLEELVRDMRGVPYPKRLIAYNKLKLQCLRILEMHGETAQAAAFLTKAAVCHPEYLDKPEFFANPRLNDLAKDICGKVALIDKRRLKY